MAVAVPNFGDLASQQNAANNAASNLTNQANRPNQFNPYGSTTWGLGPNGTWTSTTGLSGGAQNLFDTTLSGQQQLGSQISAGAPQATFGAQQNVIDAWNALQEPGLTKSANADRARAAAMGITLGSNANNDIERNIGTNRATSTNQGILQGVNAWNQLYQNQLAGYNSNVNAMGALGATREGLNPNKWNPTVPTSAAYIPQTIYGAALDQFSAQRQNENADIARSQAQTDSYVNAARALGGSQGIGGILSGIGGLWNTGKDVYNTVSGWF